EKFYRGRAEGDPETSGSGLGLAFVKEAVTALGGEVTVESRLGAGSVFRVRLPGSPGDGTSER
ncbi:MAG TPA: ATP-binding protein, partial [Acidobacteriota bacterium]|nr:ATP-binding protein [Acidobacteriota bacterium]